MHGLGAAVFLSSAAVMVLEISAARLLAPYVGMSVYTWTCIIATILAGMSAGHWVGGRLSEVERAVARRRLAALFAAGALGVVAVPFLLRLFAPMLVVEGVPFLFGISALSVVLFFAPSSLIACVSPMLTKMAIDMEPEARGRALGRMYALGALGSILGTLAAGFVFISWIGTNGTILSVAAVLGLLAAGFARAARHRTATLAVVAAAALSAGLLVTGRGGLAGICQVESRYYCIRVVDYDDADSEAARMMVLDHMAHGINERRDPGRLHSPYVELTDTVVRGRFGGGAALRSYFIGGGAYTLPRAWATAYPDGRHVVAEIDPAVTRAARDHMWFAAHPSVHVVHADARRHLQSLAPAPQFDVVVGDAFHDISVPSHLVTVEFARQVAARLTPRGLYVLNIVDRRHEPAFLLSQVRTLAEAFTAVEVWSDEDQARAAKRLTYLVIASNDPVPMNQLQSDRFPDRRWFRRTLNELAGRLGPDDVPLMTDDLAPVDRLLSDVASFGN
ncbi:MAG: fused MFS/spermidine synthase [Rhodospirillaceae bacterium]